MDAVSPGPSLSGTSSSPSPGTSGPLPGGKLPCRLVGVERALPGYRAPFLAWATPGRCRISPAAQRLQPTCTVVMGAPRPPASTSSPCHDGFTLARSGHATTASTTRPTSRATPTEPTTTTAGTAGPRARPTIAGILALRERQKRNLIVTLLLSQGVPLIQAGDELGRTQRGNNNAYCQDNEITWLDWDLDDDRRAFLAFVRQVISLRAAEPVFRRRTFFHGRPIHGRRQGPRRDRRGRPGDDRRGMEHRLGRFPGHAARGRRDRRNRRVRPVRSSETLSSSCSMRQATASTSGSRRGFAASHAQLVHDTTRPEPHGLDADDGYVVQAAPSVAIRFPRT